VAHTSDSDIDKTAPPQLAQMLSIDPAFAEAWRPEELAAILRHQLETPIESDLLETDDASAADGGAVGARMKMTYGELLASPQPPLALLERAKRFAKACRSHPDGPLPPEVATVLYFACIVVARTRCNGARISALDDATLSQGLRWALSQHWVDRAIRELFESGLAQLKPREV
jgi:hypothetical protein